MTWCCGDLHLENFGSYKGDNGLAYFDLNDFDEAALAPTSWELVRVLTSIHVGTQSYGLSGISAQILAARFLDAYSCAIASGNARWVERETARGLVRELLEQVRTRKRLKFLNARSRRKGKVRHFLVDTKKLLSVSDAERKTVHTFMGTFAKTQDHPEFYRVIDVARRVAGTGSLGVARYAILVEGKGSPDQNYILDLKQALPSSIGTHLKAIQPEWKNEAGRIVAVQRRMQAISMASLHPVVIGATSYVLRGLQPTEDRVPLANYHDDLDSLIGVVEVMGACVAWAQLRSSGHLNSATSDELAEFTSGSKWRHKLHQQALDLSWQVQEDWKTYCKAYDDGVFQPIGQVQDRRSKIGKRDR